jgi:single-strand DNA-binding protein
VRNPTKNRVEITGYLAAAPTIRALPDGGQVASFAAYTKRAYRRGNQLIIERERHRLIGYGEIAHAASGLKTGMLVQCIGRMRTESWKNRKSGEQRYATRIVVTELTIITRTADTRASELPDTDVDDAAEAA